MFAIFLLDSGTITSFKVSPEMKETVVMIRKFRDIGKRRMGELALKLLVAMFRRKIMPFTDETRDLSYVSTSLGTNKVDTARFFQQLRNLAKETN